MDPRTVSRRDFLTRSAAVALATGLWPGRVFAAEAAGDVWIERVELATRDGREDRTAPADERHSDLTFSINDAFKRARRQLQDQVSRMQGR